MTIQSKRWTAFLLSLLLPISGLLADETSVLVSILVRKGILTEQEAQDVLNEAALLNSAATVAPAAAAPAAPVTVAEPATSKKKEPVYATAASKIATGLKIGGRLQVQYAGLQTDVQNREEQPDPTRHFFLRRVYLGVATEFNEQWSAKVTYDFAGAGFDAAFLNFDLDEHNAFTFGLTKVNMGYEETLSSASIPAIERSGMTRYFVETNNGRRLGAGSYRIGAFYDGSAGNVFWGGAVTNPERPRNAVDAAADGDVFNNGLAAWANIGYRLVYEGGNAVFGLAGGYMDDQGGVVGVGKDLTIINAYADGQVGSFRLYGEVMSADDGNHNPWGFYITPTYSFTPFIEGVARFGYVDSDGRGISMSDGVRSAPSGGTMDKLYEGYLGANWYIMGNNLKLQGGMVLGRTEDALDGGEAEANTIGVRSQLQVNF